MTVATITVADATNPVELQEWFNAHSSLQNWRIVSSNGIFYIFYE